MPKTNCISSTYIFKTTLGSINGSFTEGNVATIKKITTPDGNMRPYISGQSQRHAIRAIIAETGVPMSPLFGVENEKGVDVTAGLPEQYIDDDLFGFMIAVQGKNRRRTAPARVSAAVGLFPFRGDRDLGTKSKEGTDDEGMGAGGNMFETEIYYNYFRSTVLLEVDRVGVFRSFELSKEEKEKLGESKVKALSSQEKRKRISMFYSALLTLWGGGKQSRILTDIAPKFIVTTVQSAKSPILLEGITMNEREELCVEPVIETLKDNKNIIQNTFIGLRSGTFSNEEKVRAELQQAGFVVKPLNESISDLLSAINTIDL
jgi:CRISPR-associated protein Cst2